MTTTAERMHITALVAQAIAAGARQDRACAVIFLNQRTLQRWQCDPASGDQRPHRVQQPRNKLGEVERAHILHVANSEEYGHLPPAKSYPGSRITGNTLHPKGG